MKEFYEAAADLVPFDTHLFRYDPEGTPSADDYPHVVLWGDLGWEFSGDQPGWDASLSDKPDHVELTIHANYVGLSREAVNLLARRTREALNRAVLTVPGYHCNPLKQRPVFGIDSDESVQLSHGHPYYAVDEYHLIASKEKP